MAYSNFVTQITDGKAFRDKNFQNMIFSCNRISRQTQAIELSLRSLALALARPLTFRQPLLQAWTSAVDPQRTTPLCSLLCGHIPCHFMSPSFFRSSSYVEVRRNSYVRVENSSKYHEHERQATTYATTQQQAGVVAVAVGRNF